MTAILPIIAVPSLVSAAGPSPDAELIAMCRRYLAIEADQNRLMELMFAAADSGDKEGEEALFEAQRETVGPQRQLLGDLMEMIATTPEGMRLKAQVAMTRVQVNLDDTCMSSEDHVMWSLARDMLALAGGRA